MSKSKGNVVVPTDLLDQYGPDAVRYWAANGRYGVDTAFDLAQLKTGRRLAVKLLNAAKFVLSLPGPAGPATAAVDQALLAALDGAAREATSCLDRYDHAGALAAAERFFWMFCDDYLELVKARAYGPGAGGASARAALRSALDVQLRLLAPFLPFVTEEAWSWWRDGSVHQASWPATVPPGAASTEVLSTAAAVLGEVRKAKAAARVSIRAEAARVVVRGPDEAVVRAAEADLRAAGNITDFAVEPSPDGELATEVILGEAAGVQSR
jgi:valyl-tRNA synthetase